MCGPAPAQILRRSGTERQKRLAERIQPVLRRPHVLLVTLLVRARSCAGATLYSTHAYWWFPTRRALAAACAPCMLCMCMSAAAPCAHSACASPAPASQVCNALAAEALPLVLDRLADPATAIIVSVTVVLLFGEVAWRFGA